MTFRSYKKSKILLQVQNDKDTFYFAYICITMRRRCGVAIVVTMSQNRWHRLLVASFTPPSMARLPQLISWSQ